MITTKVNPGPFDVNANNIVGQSKNNVEQR